MPPSPSGRAAAAPNDLAQLGDPSQETVLACLQERYAQEPKRHCTYVGPNALVSFNPYSTPFTPVGEDEPHPYVLARRALVGAATEGNQMLIITGASGAGKTESAKQCVHAIAEVAGSELDIEKKLVHAQALIEAFGCAKTNLNDNSSRFGKMTEIFINEFGRVCQAHVWNMNFEASRVVIQAEGERNYHIFYQLIAAAAAGDLQGYDSLCDEKRPMMRYALINDAETKDAAKMLKCFEAAQLVGIPESEWRFALDAVAGILHLGNASFTADDLDLQWACHFFGCTDVEGFCQALLSKRITARNEDVVKPLETREAEQGRDALSKAIFSRVFAHMVSLIDDQLKPADVQFHSRKRFVGILDIFGFEALLEGPSSLEQLLINYANEEMHHIHVMRLVTQEKALYTAEGVPVPDIEIEDNQPTLDLLKEKLFQALEDQAKLFNHGSDRKFLDQVANSARGHPNMALKPMRVSHKIKTRPQDEFTFEIKHFAGPIVYSAYGFCTKNSDPLFNSAQVFLKTNANVGRLFANYNPDEERDRAHKTISSQFRAQLSKLLGIMDDKSTSLSYIRCFTPNQRKSPVFNPVHVTTHLAKAGVLESVIVYQQGFPFRNNHQAFQRLFGYGARGSITDVCNKVLGDDVPREQWALGKTQVFYRHDVKNRLMEMRQAHLTKASRLVQGAQRRHLRREMNKRLAKADAILARALDAPIDEHSSEGIKIAMDKATSTLGRFTRLFDERPARFAEAQSEHARLFALEDLLCRAQTALEMDEEMASSEAVTTLGLLKTRLNEEMAKSEAVPARITEQLKMCEEQLEAKGQQRLERVCSEALETCEEDKLTLAMQFATSLNKLSDEKVVKIQALLGDKTLRLKAQLRTAVGAADAERQLKIELEMYEMGHKLNRMPLARYPHLRPVEQFLMLNEPRGGVVIKRLRGKTTAETSGMLSYSSNGIRASLTFVKEEEISRIAVSMFDCVRQYCLPAMAEDVRDALGIRILNIASTTDPLHTEALLQCAKQATSSPSPQHRALALELLGAVIGVRPCDPGLMPYLWTWLEDNVEGKEALNSYTRLLFTKSAESKKQLAGEEARPNKVMHMDPQLIGGLVEGKHMLAGLRGPFRTLVPARAAKRTPPESTAPAGASVNKPTGLPDMMLGSLQKAVRYGSPLSKRGMQADIRPAQFASRKPFPSKPSTPSTSAISRLLGSSQTASGGNVSNYVKKSAADPESASVIEARTNVAAVTATTGQTEKVVEVSSGENASPNKTPAKKQEKLFAHLDKTVAQTFEQCHSKADVLYDFADPDGDSSYLPVKQGDVVWISKVSEDRAWAYATTLDRQNVGWVPWTYIGAHGFAQPAVPKKKAKEGEEVKQQVVDAL